jgi:hypothetical protein
MILGKITNPKPINDMEKSKNVQIIGVFSSRFLRLLNSNPIKIIPRIGISPKI